MIRAARRICCLATFFIVSVAVSASAQPDDRLRVLLLQSFSSDLPYSENFLRGLTGVLDVAGRPYDLYIENLDAARFSGDSQRAISTRYLSGRYADAPVDIVIANARPAGNLLAGAPELLPDARRIFVNGPMSEARDQVPHDSLLLSANFAFDRALSEVMRLSNPRELHVVIGGTSPAAATRLDRFRDAVAGLDVEIPVIYLTDFTLEEILDHVARLPRDAAVYELGVFRDAAGRQLVPLEVTERIAEASNAPVFTYWIAEGSGTVGGLVLSAEALGEETARALLTGPEEGIIDDAGLSFVYDWQALRRWGFTEEELPARATLLNREPGLLEEYTAEAVATLAVLIVLLAMTIALAATILARRRKERELRESEARLTAVIEQLAEGLVIFDTSGRATHWNPAALAMHGFAVGDAAPSAEQMDRLFEISDVETGEPLPAEERVVQRILRGETVHNVERRVRRTDQGWEKMFAFSGSVVHGTGGETLIVIVIADVTERRESDERQRLLMREVDHRAKNALAVVQAVVKLTRADTMPAFREAVEGRVSALGRSHSILAENCWNAVDFSTILRAELAPYAGNVAAHRVSLEGPAVTILPDAVQTVTMILHELATNAVKYGCLSQEQGSLSVRWRLEGAGGLRVFWEERGGPTVSAPEGNGFGTRMISALVGQIDGDIGYDWRAEGLCVSLGIARGITKGKTGEDDVAVAPRRARTTNGGSRPLRVLVVEDEPLIAEQIVSDLASAGHIPIGPARSLDDGLRRARSESTLDGAFLDMNLAGEVSTPIAHILRERGVPFALATGYTDAARAKDGVAVLEKPFSSEEMLDMLETLVSVDAATE
ncbi:HWE histidine kinase domain-containing protein [Marivita sp.]|uniref:HWE histidine kinase domain-containing protein n=1 Tax=Marivita sp. TaxID=2003365 RepID=UPI0025B87D44|nr:HWE histidine kinase domain-containing protein [Marivita sp.]